MSEKKFDYLIFIGRMQPVHCGHISVINHALNLADNVIVLLGSAYQPRSLRNPWTWKERATMLRSSLDESTESHVHIGPLRDTPDDESWVAQVQGRVAGLIKKSKRVGLIGHSKDATSYYLKLFPQWDNVEVDNLDGISATPIREAYMLDILPDYLTVPPKVASYLHGFKLTQDYIDLVDEHEFIMNYKKDWANTPWPVTFQTVDAVVIQSGHILMIERGDKPGKGLMALPGGFLDPDETLLDACLRELRQETKLKVPKPVLKGSVVAEETFDDPNRGERGRMITQAFLIQLPPGKLPRVQGGDDAKKAFWIPIAELDSELIFSDHPLIIQKMLSLVN